MAEVNAEFPTVIGKDAKFKGDLTFDKSVRIEGNFEGTIKSKGSLHIAEGAHVQASVESANVRIEGECKGNLVVTEKLHLMDSARMEGDLRTNRLEIADGAIFVGKVIVGQASPEPTVRRPSGEGATSPSSVRVGPDSAKTGQPPKGPGAAKARSEGVHMPAGS